MSYKYCYFGGGVAQENETYIERLADKELYEELKAGIYCCVLEASQSGKSSLLIRTKSRLVKDGVECVSIDLSGEGLVNVSSSEQWYKALVDTLSASFQLDLTKEWQEQNQLFSGVKQLHQFVEKILLAQIEKEIVIFIDEIGAIESLNLHANEFVDFLISCYEQRNNNSEYKRLTFCLLGIPSLRGYIPYSIGIKINLRPFQLNELEPLKLGLHKNFPEPQEVLQEILKWTGGQPFQTQKLCHFIVKDFEKKGTSTLEQFVEQIVHEYIIDNWLFIDSPKHLQTIVEKVLKSKRAYYLLKLYKQILQEKSVEIPDDPQEQDDLYELKLSGLVIDNGDKFIIYNPIYEIIFNKNWIETKQLWELCPYAEALKLWDNSKAEKELYLLKGDELKEGIEWSSDKELSSKYYVFLEASKNHKKVEQLAALQTTQLLTLEATKLVTSVREKLVVSEKKESVALVHKQQKQVSKGYIFTFLLLLGAIIVIVPLAISKFDLLRADRALVELDESVLERASTLEELDESVSERASTLEELDESVSERASTLEELDESISKNASILREYYYYRLQYELKYKNWGAADDVTNKIVSILRTELELSDRDYQIICQEFRTIDSLWKDYSNGKFGFSVQSRIWQSSEVNRDIDDFKNRVGWESDRITNADSINSIDFYDKAPEGQLPRLKLRSWEGIDGIGDRTTLLNKIASCDYR